MNAATLSGDLLRRFLSLASQLSPENLACDGELSQRAVRARARSLRSQWRGLEQELGRRVDEGEVWAAEVERQRTERGNHGR